MRLDRAKEKMNGRAERERKREKKERGGRREEKRDEQRRLERRGRDSSGVWGEYIAVTQY